MHTQGNKALFRGFLIIEYPKDTFHAYRNMAYYEQGSPSYTVDMKTSVLPPSLGVITQYIDDAHDQGEFTTEMYDEVRGVEMKPRVDTEASLNAEIRQLRQDFRDNAIPEDAYRRAYNDILERKRAIGIFGMRLFSTEVGEEPARRGYTNIPTHGTPYSYGYRIPRYVEPASIEEALRWSMEEEAIAASWYRRRAAFALTHGDSVTAELWLHIAGEEDDHYKEFEDALNKLAVRGDGRY